MKPNRKLTQWTLPTAAAATLCIGMGAEAFQSSPADAISSHSSVRESPGKKNPGGVSAGETDGTIVNNSENLGGKQGIDAGRRAKHQPTPISSFPNAQTVDFDVAGIESINAMGDALNEVFTLDIGDGSRVIGLGWNVTIEAFDPSWLAEMGIRITDDPITTGINLNVGVADEGPGVESYNSGGIVNMADLGLDFVVGANGTLRLEFFEGFVDFPNVADGVWLSGTLTIQYVTAGAPCVGDLTGDGNVDVSDLLDLLSGWGACGGSCPGDLNDDNVVDVSDLLVLLSNWGACPPGGADPVGVCCMSDFTCMEKISEEDCITAGGEYGGDYTTCAFCPAEPDGETCETALPVVIDGPAASGDTTGNAIPTAPLCGGITPDQPTAWFTVTGTNQQLTAYACTADDAASVAVYCGDCAQELEPLTCLASGASNNDQSQCGNPFDGQATWCAGEGEVYHIAVWRTTPGPVDVVVTSGADCTSDVVCSLLQDPVCPFDGASENCQGGPTGGTWASSDIRIEDIQDPPAGGVYRADDFHATATGNITSVCWQGVDLALAGGVVSGPCPDNDGQGQDFAVTYYFDDGGRPGNVMAGPFIGTPDHSRIGFVAFAFGDAGHIDYTMEHPPVAVEAGQCYWIEVVGQSPEGGCAFFWKPSPEGNGRLFSKTGDAPEYPVNPTAGLTNPDRHFCINIAQGDPDICLPATGACCVGGTCSTQTSADCANLDGCFFPGAACADVVCLQETYTYECADDPVGGIGAGSGTIVWALAYDVIPGEETIDSLQIALGTGAPLGSTFNWAVYDTQSVPNATNAVRTGTGVWSAEGIRVDISIAPYTVTSGRFWVAAWVDYTEGFPAGYNATVPAPPGTTYASLTPPADANSLAGLAELTTLNPALTGVWQIRAD